ncbi:MAG TPA: hypothetical protein PKW90_27540, partial [Myxococcota bacterium]|nr:hypothetical protein [Myxococcota bacterium]
MWWIPAALAHAPHEVVVSAAAPADLAEGSWFLLSTNEGLHLQRSKDQGRSWEMVGGAPLEDELQELAEVQGTVLALAPGRLWWTVDQGESWQKQSLPASIVDMQGGERLLLVGDGIWGGSPETLQKEAEGSFV